MSYHYGYDYNHEGVYEEPRKEETEDERELKFFQPETFALKWDLPPEVSFSDFSVVISMEEEQATHAIETTASTGSATYHLHKHILAAGPRRLPYFTQLFQERNNRKKITIHLPKYAADCFPLLLDFVYGTTTSPTGNPSVDSRYSSYRYLKGSKAAGLYYLADYFENAWLRERMGRLVEKCFEKTGEDETYYSAAPEENYSSLFAENFDVRQGDLYPLYNHAVRFDTRLIPRIIKVCGHLLQDVSSDDEILNAVGIDFWLKVFQVRHKDRPGAPLSCAAALIPAICAGNKPEMTPDLFRRLTNKKYVGCVYFDFLLGADAGARTGTALELLVLEERICGGSPRSTVETNKPLSTLQKHCLAALAFNSTYPHGEDEPTSLLRAHLEGELKLTRSLGATKYFASPIDVLDYLTKRSTLLGFFKTAVDLCKRGDFDGDVWWEFCQQNGMLAHY